MQKDDVADLLCHSPEPYVAFAQTFLAPAVDASARRCVAERHALLLLTPILLDVFFEIFPIRSIRYELQERLEI